MEVKKKNLFYKKAKGTSLIILSLFLFFMAPKNAYALAPSGIGGNGTGGIVIDINAAPYTDYANIPTWGQYAYGPSGCAWFASARVNQLTGANCTIYSGKSWYNSAYQSFGFSRGSTLQAKALACYENHVAVVESVSGDQAVVSEGGFQGTNSNANTGYCLIHTMSKATLESGRNGAFLGYVYLGAGSSAPAGALSYSSVNVEWTDTWNALLKGTISNPNRLAVSNVGAKVWDSAGNLVVDHSEACGLNTSTVNQQLNIVGEALPTGLRQGETYTFRLWASANGATYESGTGSFTIKDDQKPVITDVSITDISETGYTVTCTVTDNFRVDRVQFPTWTLYHEQDDLFPDWVTSSACSGTAEGNSYTYRVNVSDHNYEMGEYLTHIYAYDPAGNEAAAHAPVQVIQKNQQEPEPPVNPSTPSVPTNPANPSTPSVPTNPANPSTPTAPANPTNPNAPAKPIAPTVPQNPANTNNAGQGTFTMVFDGNGGAVVGQQTITVKVNQQLGNLPIAKRKGYLFRGWYLEKSGGQRVYAYSRPVYSGYRTAYAQWEKVTKPKKAVITSLRKRGNGKFTVKYRRASQAKGYEICYSTNKKFKYSTKKVTASSLSKTVKGLKKKKAYYVRVRAYKIDSTGSKVYGSYSKAKKVKV